MTDPFVGLDHVQIAIPPDGEAAARAFYADQLGMTLIEKPESLRGRGGFWLQTGIHQLHIGIQKDFVPASKAHPAFAVRSWNEYREALARRGVAIVPDDALPGVDRFYVFDPFGNRLEFVGRD
jgi:catechol 2,3-dioxygenase-like lactoylglutathione lyase family enzyme